MDINYDSFISLLRSALNYLYEPDQLRRNPLGSLLSVAGRVDTPKLLQEKLIEAIEALKPGEDELSLARDWLTHDVLFFRYVRGYSREAVASQLGISDRQLSREQRTAIETLAIYLWKHYHLDASLLTSPDALPETSPGAQPADLTTTSVLSPDMENEGLSWVEELPLDRPASWRLTLESVIDVLTPLLGLNKVQLRFEPGQDLPDLLVPQNALRQSLLILCEWLVSMVEPEGELVLSPVVSSGTLSITVRVVPPPGRPAFPEDAGELPPGIEVSRQLLEREGGRLSLDSEHAAVTASIPAVAQVPVLVIDDNADTIQLFQRYVQGTRYALAGTGEPGEIERLVEKFQPRIILLDVMMPEVDGWEMLPRLRNLLKGHRVSILICSILPMQSLALSLGANGFLQKPVLPQDFLRVLDEQVELIRDEGE